MSDSPYDLSAVARRQRMSPAERQREVVDYRITQLIKRIEALEAAVVALQENQTGKRDDKND